MHSFWEREGIAATMKESMTRLCRRQCVNVSAGGAGEAQAAQVRTEVAQARTEVAQGRTEVPQGRIKVAHFRTEVAQDRGGDIVA